LQECKNGLNLPAAATAKQSRTRTIWANDALCSAKPSNWFGICFL